MNRIHQKGTDSDGGGVNWRRGSADLGQVVEPAVRAEPVARAVRLAVQAVRAEPVGRVALDQLSSK